MGNLCFCWQVLHDENEQVLPLLLTLLALPLSSHSPSLTTPSGSSFSAKSPFAENGQCEGME